MACLGAMLCWESVAPGVNGTILQAKQFID